MLRILCFLFLFLNLEGTSGAVHLHFICFSSEKSRAFPIPTHFLFSTVLQESQEKRKCVYKGTNLFFPCSLIILSLLCCLLVPCYTPSFPPLG